MKRITIKPGSIITWAEYGKLKTWWAKLRKKELPHNAIAIMLDNMELYTNEDNDFCMYEPKKAYSKNEVERLVTEITMVLVNSQDRMKYNGCTSSVSMYTKSKDFIDFINAINIIRPNTINLETCRDLKLLNDNKYYRLPQAKEL